METCLGYFNWDCLSQFLTFSCITAITVKYKAMQKHPVCTSVYSFPFALSKYQHLQDTEKIMTFQNRNRIMNIIRKITHFQLKPEFRSAQCAYLLQTSKENQLPNDTRKETAAIWLWNQMQAWSSEVGWWH